MSCQALVLALTLGNQAITLSPRVLAYHHLFFLLLKPFLQHQLLEDLPFDQTRADNPSVSIMTKRKSPEEKPSRKPTSRKRVAFSAPKDAATKALYDAQSQNTRSATNRLL